MGDITFYDYCIVGVSLGIFQSTSAGNVLGSFCFGSEHMRHDTKWEAGVTSFSAFQAYIVFGIDVNLVFRGSFQTVLFLQRHRSLAMMHV